MENNFAKSTNLELLTQLCGPSGAYLAQHRLSEVFGLTHSPQTACFAKECSPPYLMNPSIAAAKELLSRALMEKLVELPCLSIPSHVRDYLAIRIGNLQHEVFVCIFVDSQHKLLACEEMFRGTVNQTAVYPREVIKRALALNSSGVILAHNHPSGSSKPSTSDEHLTRTLASALALVDVRVIDHLVVAPGDTFSFAESGLI